MALSSAELAKKLGTDTKTLRKFLRSHLPKDVQPGQGGRYSFDAAEVKRLEKAWTKWSANKVDKDEPKEATTKTRKGKGKAKPAPEADVEEADDEEPSAEDLEDIDDDSIDDIDDLLDEDADE